MTISNDKGRTMVVLLFMVMLITVLTASSKGILDKYYFYGSDNIHSQHAIEKHLSKTYGEDFVTVKKHCYVRKEDNLYKYTVHYVMSDDKGLLFDTYEYGYGMRAHDGDFNGDDYYLVRDNLVNKRLENKLNNEVDLSRYRTWDQIKDNENFFDFTITYDGTNAAESAEAAAQIFRANREVAISANVISLIQDTEGNEIYRFNYNSLKEDLENEKIDANNISDVQNFIEKKLEK